MKTCQKNSVSLQAVFYNLKTMQFVYYFKLTSNLQQLVRNRLIFIRKKAAVSLVLIFCL